jgi:hypothetical protein
LSGPRRLCYRRRGTPRHGDILPAVARRPDPHGTAERDAGFLGGPAGVPQPRQRVDSGAGSPYHLPSDGGGSGAAPTNPARWPAGQLGGSSTLPSACRPGAPGKNAEFERGFEGFHASRRAAGYPGGTGGAGGHSATLSGRLTDSGRFAGERPPSPSIARCGSAIDDCGSRPANPSADDDPALAAGHQAAE